MACRCLWLTVLLVAIAAGVYYQCCTTPEVSIPKVVKQWGSNKDTSIRPFVINVANKTLEDLKSRLLLTRYADSWELDDFTFGVGSATLQKIVKYWTNSFDWRKQEAKLNSLKQFKTSIGGLDIHFVHEKSKQGSKAVPVILLHGWPGSVWEFYNVIPTLLKDADTDFEVVCPSLPGYGFSQAPQKPGFNVVEAAHVFVALMKRLGHDQFYVQGGDWGSVIATVMAQLYPENVLGLHINMFPVNSKAAFFKRFVASLHPYLAHLVGCSEDDYKQLTSFSEEVLEILQESGYFHLQSTKPDTVGCALHDSPAGLAAYIIEKFSSWTDFKYRNAPDGGIFLPDFPLTLDDMLTNVMIYWLTGTQTSSMRFYKEFFRGHDQTKQLENLPVDVPAGLARFPHEVSYSAEFMAQSKYHSIVQYNVMPRGGHFAAFQEPELLAKDFISFIRIVQNARK